MIRFVHTFHLGWRLRIQSAVRLPGGEPEPDLAVVMGPAGATMRATPHQPRSRW